jgi:prepilin-type N-terminal cleavage/methylation domain-containing protein/prepilin-type processing-associated H-X9-DG protein
MIKKNNFKKGFTLLELLIVLTVIIILASLLLPALSKARQRTQSTKCLANLKQLITAVALYAQDYGKYPNITPGAPDQPFTGDGGNGKLATLLNPFVNNKDVFICPANTTELYGPNPEGIKTSYKYNEVMRFTNVYSTNMLASWSVVLIDNKDWAPRHLNGANLAYMDGHVEWHPQSGDRGYATGSDPYGNVAWYNWGRPP